MGRGLLVGLACGDLAAQMALFIIQILQLQKQSINLLPRLRSKLLSPANFENGVAVEAAELRQVGVEEFLLL